MHNPPSRDTLVADTQQRINALKEQFKLIGDTDQPKLDAATTDRITADVHAQVDSLIQRIVGADGGRVDVGGLQSALGSIFLSPMHGRRSTQGSRPAVAT